MTGLQNKGTTNPYFFQGQHDPANIHSTLDAADFFPSLKTRLGFGKDTLRIPVSYNTLVDGSKQYTEVEAPDFVALDTDGVLANEIDFNEHVAQIFLLKRGIVAWTQELRNVRDTGEDLWAYVKREAKKLGELQSDKELSEELREIESVDLLWKRNVIIADLSSIMWMRGRVVLLNWTNREHFEANRFLKDSGLERCVDGYCGRMGELRKKPNADGLVAMQKALGFGKRGFMVGDSVSDLGELSANAALFGFDLTPIGVLPPSHGFNEILEARLFEAGAKAVFPSLMHLVKDLATHVHEDYYQLVKWELPKFQEYRHPSAPKETAEFARYVYENNIRPPESFVVGRDYLLESFQELVIQNVPAPKWMKEVLDGAAVENRFPNLNF